MIDECDPDMDFGGRAVRISCCDTFSEGPEAEHLCLNPTVGMVSCQSLPERFPEVPPGVRVSSRARAARHFQGRPFLRSGIVAVAKRGMAERRAATSSAARDRTETEPANVMCPATSFHGDNTSWQLRQKLQ